MTAVLEQLFLEHGVEFRRGGEHHHVRSGWIGVDCPRCGPDSRNFHLGIHSRDLFAVCWRCGHLSLRESLQDLGLPASSLRGLIPGREAARRPESERGRPGTLSEPPGLGPMLPPHRRYLRGRGFDPDELERLWGLRGFGRLGGQLAWRIWAPVVFGGRPVSWHARAIGGDGKRWLSAPDAERPVPADRVLYGWDFVRSACVLVEGPADAWRIGPGAVAVLGLRTSARQIDLLRRVPRRAVCFDAEPAAQRRAAEIVRQLSQWPGETFLAELDSGDPGEAGPEEVRRIRREILGDRG